MPSPHSKNADQIAQGYCHAADNAKPEAAFAIDGKANSFADAVTRRCSDQKIKEGRKQESLDESPQ